MLRGFFERCHHVICCKNVNRPSRNINLDQNLVPTGFFVVVQFSDDARDAYAKKLTKKSQRKAIVEDLCRAGTDIPVKKNCMTDDQWARDFHIFLLTNAINLFRPKYGQTVVAAMKFQKNLCFAVTKNEVPADIVLELHDELVSETSIYDSHIWCHYIGWDLKICIDNLEKDESACTWRECCTKACKIMHIVGIVEIINSETIRKYHALVRIQEQFTLLSKEKYQITYLLYAN